MRLIPGARVLMRADGSLQVGVREPLILDGLTGSERRFVERLESAGSVAPSDLSRYSAVIERLHAARLLARDTSDAAQPSPHASVNDGGPVGCGIALALARAGWAVAIHDEGRAIQAPRGTYDPGSLAVTRQAAASDTIRRLLPDAAVHAGWAPSDVDIIVSHGAPLLEAAVPLMSRDKPHLFVTTDERGARVGPLVIPGQSACGTCAGLSRLPNEPEWPMLSLQLTARGGLPQGPSDVQAQVVGLVVGALTWWRTLGDESANSDADWLDAVWIVDHQRAAERELLASHPECGCGAAGPVGDELAARRARMPSNPHSPATS